jgi:hypothetical protein
MGRALPGEHYCLKHQGNHSHYDEINCTVCKLQVENAQLKALISKLEATIEALEDDAIEAGITWEMDHEGGT